LELGTSELLNFELPLKSDIDRQTLVTYSPASPLAKLTDCSSNFKKLVSNHVVESASGARARGVSLRTAKFCVGMDAVVCFGIPW
jgi:hypothetical protein